MNLLKLFRAASSFLSVGFLTALMAMTASHASAATLTYNFDDGTNQGWTTVAASVSGYKYLVSTPNGGPNAQSGTYAIFGAPHASRDGSHETSWLRSPQFKLDGTGDLSFYLMAGEGNGFNQGTGPANTAAIPVNSSGTGFQGAGLRRVSDNSYVLIGQKSTEGEFWQQITFSQASLAAYANDGNNYTLDFFDYYNGDWGWTALDTVSIPGVAAVPEPGTLALAGMAGLMLLGSAARRYRRRAAR